MTEDAPIAFDSDYFAWTQEQARILRNLAQTTPMPPLDALHLADEIDGVGQGEKQRLGEALEMVLVVLIKLENSAARAPRKIWRNMLAVERRRAKRILRASPSLALALDLNETFQSARMIAAADLGREGGFDGALPSQMPYALKHMLDDGFLPENRHGLE